MGQMPFLLTNQKWQQQLSNLKTSSPTGEEHQPASSIPLPDS